MTGKREFWLAVCLSQCLLVLLAAAVLAQGPENSEAATLHVAPGGDCGGASPCYGTIQAAVDEAVHGDSIKIAQGIYTTGVGFQVVHINKAITLTGGYTLTDWVRSFPLTQTTVIDAESVARRRGIYIDGTAVPTITLDGLTIQNGLATDTDSRGGGVYGHGGALVLRNSHVQSNAASGTDSFGGGVYFEAGTLILEGNTIEYNIAESDTSVDEQGGGVCIWDGTLLAYENTICYNEAAAFGGGLYAYNSTLEISGNMFQGNSSKYGGATRLYYGAATVTGNTFVENTAHEHGGAFNSSLVTLELVSNAVMSNTADMGGGLKVAGGTAWLVGNTIEANEADSCAGMRIDLGSTCTLVDNLIRGNEATHYYGGGICADNSALTLTHNDIISNTSVTGGGALHADGSVHLGHNTIRGNSAEDGGAVLLHRGTIDLGANTVSWNAAAGKGGVLYVETGTANLDGNVFSSNTAGTYGGSIAMCGGQVIAQNDIIAANPSAWEAVFVGGGIFTGRHLTIVDSGPYALTTGGGTAVLTNTIVATHTVAGFVGNDIHADHTLFFNSGIPCSGGAVCSNNLTGDPWFVNPTSGDYHIGAASAAIDVGVLAGVWTDLDNQPRVGVPDIGADEFWPPGALRHVYLPLILRNAP